MLSSVIVTIPCTNHHCYAATTDAIVTLLLLLRTAQLQDFQDYLSGGVTGALSSIHEINNQLQSRANTLQMLFTTKDVAEENKAGWLRVHRDLLVHSETNAYLHVAKVWEKVRLLYDIFICITYINV
jgi:hypothetical protein